MCEKRPGVRLYAEGLLDAVGELLAALFGFLVGVLDLGGKAVPQRWFGRGHGVQDAFAQRGETVRNVGGRRFGVHGDRGHHQQQHREAHPAQQQSVHALTHFSSQILFLLILL